jgi:hypothetical protein
MRVTWISAAREAAQFIVGREVLEAMFQNTVTVMGGGVGPRLVYRHKVAAIIESDAGFRSLGVTRAETTASDARLMLTVAG